MAHFAKINSQGIVQQVIVVSNSKLSSFNEPLSIAQAKNIDILKKLGGDWVQTSYNRNFRGNYAAKGFTYIAAHDIFMPPKPFPSWSLDSKKARWIPPTPYPNDKNAYIWTENSLSWVPVS